MHRIERLVADALAAPVGSAIALSIGDGGREVERLVAGHARRVPDLGGPITERTRFDVASLTKPIVTAACAMALDLDLAAPIRRWLPAAASTGTVRDLLGHAAGCAAHVEFFRQMRGEDYPDRRAELIARAAAQPASAPGERAVYSDLGYIQLGAIVERAADLPLQDAFATLVAQPFGLQATYGPIAGDVVATELDDRGLVQGRVHDENAYFGGDVHGHAGLFATIGDVARFAAGILDVHAGRARGHLRPDVVARSFAEQAAPGASWRLGWDTPSHVPGVSHAGDRWPRAGGVGHLGFTGTSLWLDLPKRRWVALLTNRVHPSRHGSADAIKALRRAINDAAVERLDHSS